MSRICLRARLLQSWLRVQMKVDSRDRFLYGRSVYMCVGCNRRHDQTDDDE